MTTLSSEAADLTALSSFLEALRPEVDSTLDRLLPSEDTAPGIIHQAMRHGIFAGGKRVRPALVVMSGEIFGAPRHTLLPGGAALEMIHTYSLIHDDLPALDNDDLRRGQPTLHRRYDEATAILAGDALLTLGLTTLASEPASLSSEQRRLACERTGLAIGTLGMIGGQVDDLLAEKHWPEDAVSALEAIHRRKTGALLRISLELGGIYAAAGSRDMGRLERLGEGIGLLFQITDDILDVEGTADSLGKTAGKDAAAQKLTYPGLFGLEESKRLLARTRDEALALAAELPREGGLFPALIHYLCTRDS